MRPPLPCLAGGRGGCATRLAGGRGSFALGFARSRGGLALRLASRGLLGALQLRGRRHGRAKCLGGSRDGRAVRCATREVGLGKRRDRLSVRPGCADRRCRQSDSGRKAEDRDRQEYGSKFSSWKHLENWQPATPWGRRACLGERPERGGVRATGMCGILSREAAPRFQPSDGSPSREAPMQSAVSESSGWNSLGMGAPASGCAARTPSSSAIHSSRWSDRRDAGSPGTSSPSATPTIGPSPEPRASTHVTAGRSCPPAWTARSCSTDPASTRSRRSWSRASGPIATTPAGSNRASRSPSWSKSMACTPSTSATSVTSCRRRSSATSARWTSPAFRWAVP